ncbi:SusC/RagA family TonB-linked outer membrane protein [Terrimonas sp. NA20]|uniref:SusC/RagA family TonB-linked outer membrane protein n=1 Tax=Terrimonas ginsenosidimutans TaxID=2908004 RepID=A0ABS9KUX9_9BACT|nr:SusC/RagA family TonB-linked outer membrane protein [Terrimonas ginsenosidimutans]MCG2616121.1 SusC/RagA family TonB-linked outer membrane protein [Terrimonas ginsenosidimutans]
MKKSVPLGRAFPTRSLLKILTVMKLTIFVILFTTFQVQAHEGRGQSINVSAKNTEIRKVLKAIERGGDYRFLYNYDLKGLKARVNINVANGSLKETLEELFSGNSLTYKLVNKNLVVVLSTNAAENVDVRITGRVTGGENEPLAGVSILEKGTSNGTTTNNNGEFSLTVADNATIVVSAIGHETQEVAVSGRPVIDLKLVPAVKLIDQVVVIGYGTASKRDLTGSIVKVAGKDVADKPNSNPIASLQGRVAGLSVVNNGTPGKAPDIRIRGTVSIGQVNPLYVVDGIFNDNIDYLNPNDIESIEVLKDPSSLAIFGVRGATGVIAITTKKAKAGQVTVNFNTSWGFKKLVDKIKLANADQFATLFAEERANNGNTDPYDYTGLSANTDWIDAVTRRGNFTNNNLSISGSTEKNRFNLGLGYISDEGIIRHERLQKMQLSFSDELKVSKAIKVGVIFNTSRQQNPYDATSVLDDARKVMPQVSSGTKRYYVRNPYGTDSLNMDLYSSLDVGLQNSGVVNPLLRVENEWNKVKGIEFRNVGSIYAEVAFLKNFTFRSTFYADISNLNKRQYTPLYYAYNPKTDQPELYSAVTRVQEDDQTWRKYQQDHVLNFKKQFGDHSLTLTGGFTTYYFGNFNRTGRVSQDIGPAGVPIPNDPRFWYMSNGFEDPTTTSSTSSQSEYSTVSYLARALYNYQNKYFLNASFRNDASSRIPEKNRNQKFWALGAAWDLTRERFMDGQSMLGMLKLKGSIGVLGNQTASRLDGTPLNYPFYPNLTSGSNAVFGTNVYTAATEDYLANPDLKWETVNAKEIGVELSAFQNRLHFEANYFSRTTNDLMTYVDRSSIGLKNKLENGGSIRNWGAEISAAWTQTFSSDLRLEVSGNITFLKNKVLSLSQDLPTGYLFRSFQNNGSAESRTQVGHPIGSFYGYQVAGIFQSYADILGSPNQAAVGAYGPGDFKFADISGPDGKGPDGKITSDDRTFIGNPTPDFTYGTSVNLIYKGFNLGIDLIGVYGNEVFRTWGSLESPFQRVNYPEEKLNRWHGAGTSNWTPILGQGNRINYNGSTYNIEDGSYFRVRNIQLGYNFGKSLLSKWSIQNLRLFVNVQNLKTWKNNLGYTPEFGGDATAFGYDNAGGAIPVVSTVGLNITF